MRSLKHLALMVVMICTFAACNPASAPAAGSQPAAAAPASTGAAPAPTPITTTIEGITVRSLFLGTDAAPLDVTFAFGSIWVANHHRSTVARVDPETMSVQAKIKVAPGPGWFVATRDALWVSNQLARGLTRIDPSTNSADTRSGDWPSCLQPVVAFAAIWESACDAHQIMRIDPKTNASTYNSALGHESLAFMGDRLMAGGDELARLDPVTGSFEPIAALKGWICGSDAETVWISDEARVYRVRPSDGKTLATFEIAKVGLVRFDEDRALVLSERQLFVIDPGINEIVRTIALTGFSPSIVAAAGALWLTNFDDSSLIRLVL